MIPAPSLSDDLTRMPPLNMTTGPVEVSPSVLAAQGAIVASPHVGDFWRLHDATLAQLGRILGTGTVPLAVGGSIRAGLSIAIANFVGPGTRVLAISNGYWGELISSICKARGAQVVDLALPPLSPVGPAQVHKALRDEGPFDLVTLVHVETNVGVVNPILEIGAAVAEAGALYFVDTACSAGAMPIDTDRIGIDIGVTGSHKCLGGLPGLAVFTLSERAWRALEAEPHEVGFFDLRAVRTHTIERPAPPAYTQPPGLFAALHAALSEIEAEGLETWFARHRRVAASFREKIREMGMAMLPDLAEGSVGIKPAEVYSDTVLAVAYPPGIDDAAFRTRLAEVYGVFVIGNLGDWSGRSFRVGLMSAPQLEPANVERTLAALASTLRDLKSSS